MKKLFLFLFFFGFLAKAAFAAPDANQMLQDSDLVLRGSSHQMEVMLHVKTPRWKRDYKIRVWMKGLDHTFAQILEPAKSKGQGFLRHKARLWQYLPTAERTILIPPSLMLDDFMGSDFSNDDFVKMSYMARDYDAKVTGEEEFDGFPAVHLELLPKPDAPVTYGKLEVWLRKSDSAPLQTYFYNEKMKHIRTLRYSGFKTFGSHEVPSVWHMENLQDKGRETTVKILNAEYGIEIPDSVFTRENLERPSL